jgi:hypothetical protein
VTEREALAADLVVTVTPGREIVLAEGHFSPDSMRA